MKKGSYESHKEKNQGEALTSPPAMEKDSHAKNKSEKFYGDSSGNKVLPTDVSHDADSGAKSGGTANTREGGTYTHSTGGSKSPFLGDTKGNKDLPVNRTKGVDSHEGGRYIASNDRYHGGRKQSPEGN